MEFPTIIRYLGENWLNEQIEFIENTFELFNTNNKEENKRVGYKALEEIEKLLLIFSPLNGIDEWSQEAKKAKKNLNDLLFELIALSSFVKKSDMIELRRKTTKGTIPEALVTKEGKEFYLECTNLESTPLSIDGKVKKLFNKSTSKFMGVEGIHLIGILNFNNKSENFRSMIESIEKRFSKGEGKTLIAFMLVNSYFQWVPNIDKLKLTKEYSIIPNPKKLEKYNIEFLERLMDVDEFRKIEKLF